MRKFIGFIAAVMLAVPVPAWAECAWVLWTEKEAMSEHARASGKMIWRPLLRVNEESLRK